MVWQFKQHARHAPHQMIGPLENNSKNNSNNNNKYKLTAEGNAKQYFNIKFILKHPKVDG